jgi:SAM-dependent methyltransferase
VTINFDPQKNPHSLIGPRTVLSHLWKDRKPTSVLDVGCGAGMWLRAAIDLGVDDVLGIDGLDMPQDLLSVPKALIKTTNSSVPIDLHRRFDLVLCLEVAEHLDSTCSECLVETITNHSDNVLFSAAIPGQSGQHHVNCQWPAYWQERFNRRGFACEDSIRWQFWDNERIAPYYRQNLLRAQKDVRAGQEPRIPGVVHPTIAPHFEIAHIEQRKNIENGSQSLLWYMRIVPQAVTLKLMRRMGIRSA